eukprot:4268113-Pyramimonas_sp.AAC.1
MPSLGTGPWRVLPGGRCRRPRNHLASASDRRGTLAGSAWGPLPSTTQQQGPCFLRHRPSCAANFGRGT